MPTAFKFTDRVTNQVVNLTDIDEKMCADLNEKVDKEHYCGLFQFATAIGTMAHVHDKQGCVDKDKLEKYLKEKHSDLVKQKHDLLIKYLAVHYKFEAWYEAKQPK